MSTFGYLVIAILTAHIPSLGVILTALRDAWICVAICIIIHSKNIPIIIFSFICFIFALIGSLTGSQNFHFMIFAYGIRDVIFLSTILVLLHARPSFFTNISGMEFFIVICMILTLFEISTQLLGLDHLAEMVFSSNTYFSAKGIESNTSGGMFGDRITAPLYSSSLIATMYCMYFSFVKSGFIYRWLTLLSSVLTLSKVVPMILVFGLAKRRPYLILTTTLTLIVMAYPFLIALIYQFPNTVISFHSASILDRYNSFFNMPSWSGLVQLNHIGMSSPAGQVLIGGDASSAPESLVISKIFDMGLYFAIPSILLFASVARLRGAYLSFGVLFIFLQVFSSLSNHLVAFIPAIVLMKRFDYRENYDAVAVKHQRPAR